VVVIDIFFLLISIESQLKVSETF